VKWNQFLQGEKKMFDPNVNLVIGLIGLPAFGEAVLWVLHKVGVGLEWDNFAGWVISVAFAVVVVSLKFYPQYDQTVVAAVAFLYTLITTYRKLVGDTIYAFSARKVTKTKRK
jgi:hypothetical protein